MDCSANQYSRAILVFDFIEAIIIMVFMYRVYTQKQKGVQLGLIGKDLDDHILELFIDYPIYGFVKKIIDDISSISSRSYVKSLSGLERHRIIANIFLVEKKNKYNEHQLLLFGLFETFKGIAHIYGSSREEQLTLYAEQVADGINYCIGCQSIPSNRCSVCRQIVYCNNDQCLQLKHTCHHVYN
jgi:hypothetical protein